MKRTALVLVLMAGFAVAQTVMKADQGKPGTQGPWPVTIAGGGLSFPDGGLDVRQASFPWLVAGADGGAVLVESAPGFVSALNSTTAPILPTTTWTGVWEETTQQASISILVSADQIGTLAVDFSSDGVNIDRTAQLSDPTLNPSGLHTLVPISKYFRVKLTNGSAVSNMNPRLQTIYNRQARFILPVTRIAQTLTDYTDVINSRGIIVGKSSAGGGTFVDVKVNPSGSLAVAASQDTSPWLVAGADGGAVQVSGTVVADLRDAGVLVTNFPSRYPVVAPDGGIDLTVRQGAGQDGGSWSASLFPPTYPSDGGFAVNSNVVAGAVYPCGAASVQNVYTMDGGAVTIGSLNPRVYVVVCNSRENTTGAIRCRADGVDPAITPGTPGSVLGVGDCIPFSNPVGRPVKCITGAGALYVTSYECAP